MLTISGLLFGTSIPIVPFPGIGAMIRIPKAARLKAISSSKFLIFEIRTPGAIVTEQPYIEEFILNCDRTVFNQIKDHVIKMRSDSELKPLEITCPSCTHQYQQIFTLDMANFFVDAS
jgi:hypothetical protein